MSDQITVDLTPVDPERIHALTRPDPNLWTLYLIYAALTTIAFPFTILPLYFRYRTLRYRFDDDGVSVSYGILFRRETYLTYSRIQDIHVSRNIFERWLGIGTVEIQTASGSASATESIAGVREFNEIRNYLYAHMRGHRHARRVGAPAGKVDPGTGASALLMEIRDTMRAIRSRLEEGSHV